MPRCAPFRLAVILATLALGAGAAAALDEQPLAVGVATEGRLAAGERDRFTFEAGAGFFVRGSIEQRSVDVVITLLGPDGAVVGKVDGPAPRGLELFRFETSAAGAHVLEVAVAEDGKVGSGEEGAVGAYAITLELLEAVAEDPATLAGQLLGGFDRPDSPGAAICVWRNGEVLFERAYGMASLTHDVPFTLETPTNIGSTSKQFTAFALLLLAERGALDLDDDVRLHVPELPDLGETVTIRHLLTHTSGYREFLNLIGMSGRRLDRGDSIDRAELIEIVRRQPALQNAPGAEFNYNNTGYGLAATIVERVSGMPFPEFMRVNVFDPLGMTRSAVRPSPAHVIPGRSIGYLPADDGGYLEIPDLGAAMGPGAIYATVGDLRRWVENLAEPRVGTTESIDAMITPFVLADGKPTGYGLGLMIDRQRGLDRIHHGGADVAHRSMLAWYPGIAAGITAQSNHALFDSGIAFRLAEAFFAAEMEPKADPAATTSDFDPASFDPATFDACIGRYELEEAPGFVLAFTREGESLHTQATGQPRLDLVPTGTDSYRIVGVEAAITFHRDEEGRVHALTLHQNGDHPAKRLEEEPTAAPVDPAELAGRYYSDEIETFYDLALEEGKLMLRQRRLDPTPLVATDAPDTYSAGRATLTFERDRHGRVIAFYAGNGRTRDVRFARVR